jgi:hypothetical protein
MSRRTARTRKTLWAATVVSIIVAVLVGTAYSPFLLNVIFHRKANWSLLSDIGRSYGAASAVIGGFALAGVAISLLLQARESRLNRIRAVRDRQLDLLRIALENPRVYGPVIAPLHNSDLDDIRQGYFATLWFNFARLGYETGVLEENHLREEIFANAFQSEPSRNYWRRSEELWKHGATASRRDRKWAQIAADEYARAIVDSTPQEGILASQSDTAYRPSPGKCITWSATLASGVLIGTLIGIRIRKAR